MKPRCSGLKPGYGRLRRPRLRNCQSSSSIRGYAVGRHVSNDLSRHHPGGNRQAWTGFTAQYAAQISVCWVHFGQKNPLELALAPREAPTHLSGRSCKPNQACGGIVGADGAAAIDKPALVRLKSR
jgi:hypothetical protein